MNRTHLPAWLGPARVALSALLLMMLTACNGSGPAEPDPGDEPYRVSAVVEWNEVMLAAVRNGPPRPTVISRALYIHSASVYDAWSMYDDNALPTALDASMRRPAGEHTHANQRAAISYAAYASLKELFPAYEANTGAFSALLAGLGYAMSDSTDPATPAGIGNLAAQAVISDRSTDGSNWENNFVDVTCATFPELYQPVNSADPAQSNSFAADDFDPSHWCPLRVPNGSLLDDNGQPMVDNDDPSTYFDQKFLTPHWGAVTPFAMDSGSQLRPLGPPKYGSDEQYTDALGNTMTNMEAFEFQFNQVLDFSANLTDERKAIAEYWADGPRSETPPGHWNSLAQGISIRDKHDIGDDAKMFLALNGAVLDASIASWDAKRHYNSCRPAGSIRFLHLGEQIQAWGGPNQGTQTIDGEDWRPYQASTFVTPAFPDFVSGHSTFSAAAAEVLRLYSGSDSFYDGVTRLHRDYNNDGVNDMLGEFVFTKGSLKFEDGTPSGNVVLHWDTFKEAADEAGISRLYGGIHHQDADRRGRMMGQEIGGLAFNRASALWNGN
ncbi:vanadium-dependent haloperoxidase [bacterium]|nr:vanadium-dependent haloperoxidase [bacterium]